MKISVKDNNGLRPLQGSYPEKDCLFLLKPLIVDFQSIENKEFLIQSGQFHYSQMIHKEVSPSTRYTQLFLQMTEYYKKRLAKDVMRLAQCIVEQRGNAEITLISLVRAGTPIGVLLQRTLTNYFHRQSRHFSVSIIRDKGIDYNALDYLLATGYDPAGFIFVDGWTAKGVINQALQHSLTDYNHSRKVSISKALHVISDMGGVADVQASLDDYVIPSALLNSTVSGLVSRSILNHQIGATDFHGCVIYSHLKKNDLSNWFIDTIMDAMQVDCLSPCVSNTAKIVRQQQTQLFLDKVKRKYQLANINYIKPGIAEATRVLLRRVPELLMVKKPAHSDIAHLEQLAEEKKIPVIEVDDMPFMACALIKSVC